MRGTPWMVSGLLVAMVTSPCLAGEQWRPQQEFSPECLLDASHGAVKLRFAQAHCYGGNHGWLSLTQTPIASRIEGHFSESRYTSLNVSSRVVSPFVSQQMFRALVDGALHREGDPKCQPWTWNYVVTLEWTCDTREPAAWQAATFHGQICDDAEFPNLPTSDPRHATTAQHLYRIAHLMLREALR
ncbi:hypothetical protein SAMN05443572_102767 [Myxococcus fulvus]|uniref:Lipoprotein n=1 Tax=Myxococcus fulvus TaxID=33 RepID=A0A511SW41_MYXFU|nr:hypothetical protein MFU01_11570 [Myxococcus fulvus]SET57981.1 hypothetical protein SAMN05443572_102767 [Myxococcus fulvus]